MGMSIRTKNILTALIAVAIVGGFIFVAEGLKSDKTDDRLAAIEQPTTTTVQRSTTTRPPATTSSTALSTTTTPLANSATTVTTARKTTATTARATTGTTAKRTTTTVSGSPNPPFNGAGTENADNTGSFTRNADGSITGAAAPACPASDPFCFYLSSSDAGGATKFSVNIRNNTARTISFPNGLRIVVTVNRPSGTQSQFVMDASSVTNLASKEGLMISSSTTFPDDGQYTFSATCGVDYGS